MPAWLIPLILQIAGGSAGVAGVRALLSKFAGQAGSTGVKGLLSRAGTPLITPKGGVSKVLSGLVGSPADIVGGGVGFEATGALLDRFVPQSADQEGNDPSFARLLEQLQTPTMDENSLQLMELLRRQEEAGALPGLLEEAGVDVNALRLV